MIPQPCMDLIELSLDMARKTEHNELAKANLDRVVGALNYALGCGHIRAQEHANWLVQIDLVRAQRANNDSARS